jgi:type II secretory pathway component HofQ
MSVSENFKAVQDRIAAAARRAGREPSSVRLVTVTKTLSYAKASDINPTIRRFLSPRGDSILDDRTNTIIIKDLEEYKNQAMAIMEALDVQGRQVMIESRIVETVKNFSQAIGIQWGFQYIADRTHGNTTNYSFPHFALIDGSPVQGGGLENRGFPGCRGSQRSEALAVTGEGGGWRETSSNRLAVL